jgi:hypothetical protein
LSSVKKKAVSPATGHDAASAKETPSGIGVARKAGTTVFAAYAPLRLMPSTRSPVANPVTPSPIASTVPAKSVPGTYGCSSPASPWRRDWTSWKLIATAWLRILSIPGPTSGSGTSTTRITSGPPWAVTWIAFMTPL